MKEDDGLSSSGFNPDETDKAAWEAARHTAEQAHQAMQEKAAAKSALRKDILRGTLLGLVAGVVYFMLMLPARQNAQRSSCQSNLKQIVLAYKQYITDNDEIFPPLYSDDDHSGRFDSARDQGWAQNIQPYMRNSLKNVKLLQCPSDANPENLTGGLQTGFTDYFMNGRVAGTNESKLNNIANTVLHGDHHSCDAACSISGTTELDAGATARHIKGANYAFADGHVKWFKPGVLTDAPVTATNYSFSP